jgi:hypothetical protein
MFTENKKQSNEKVRLLCGVSFDRKDEAKLKGAKWCPNSKMWYFEYGLDEFIENDTLHTYDFKPTTPCLISYDIKNRTMPSHILLNKLYNDAHKRWLNYKIKM